MQQKSKELVATYGQRESFLTTFNPDVQREICGNVDLCFFGGAPTLSLMNTAYGDKTAAMWLVPQLYNLSEYCGCRDKLTGNQLKECASVIATEFSYLSVTELMLFFHRFKSGRYGRFYGSIDPLIITESLRKFLGERIDAYDKQEKEKREQEARESAKNAVSWEEYSMKTYGEVRARPWERRKEKEPEQKPAEKPEPDEMSIQRVLRLAKSIETDTIADKNTKSIFVKQFQKHYGMTPKEFIKKYE